MQPHVFRITSPQRLVVFVLCCFLSACMPDKPLPPLPPEETAAPENYLMGPEDVIDVQVWKNADLSKVVMVRPDGKISLPLLGDVQAGGLTPQQLAESITEKLKEYYKEPAQVSVIVQQINSYAIYMIGEVRSPGKYVVKSGTTFVQAIALAGGFSQFASTNKIRILRRGVDNRETTIPIRYKDILEGRQANLVLRPNDSVIVP